MNVELLHPLGAVVTGLSARDVDSKVADRLRTLLADHGVVVLPEQDIDDSDFVTFLKQFGPLMFTTGETPVDRFPDLNVVSNVGRTTPPRSSFHTDTSYVSEPPAYTALRAVAVPSRGGDTLFSDQYRAFDTLPNDLRDHLRDRLVTHVVTGLDPDVLSALEAETSARHPLFRDHPISGRTALFLTTPARCVAISGLDKREARDTIEFLFQHSIAPDNLVRHTWSPGDIVIWDNRCVLHRADHSSVDGDRIMHRCMVANSVV